MAKPNRVGPCTRCNKDRPLWNNGLCNPCQVMARYLARPPVICPRCQRERIPFVVKSGMCKPCYQVLRISPDATLVGTEAHKQRIGEATKTHRKAREASPRWKGGRFVAPDGYVRMVNPDVIDRKAKYTDRYLLEHRVVAEQTLGRPLLPTEVVHHRNGVRHDNRPENLQVLPSVSAHRRLHVAQARQEREAAARRADI